MPTVRAWTPSEVGGTLWLVGMMGSGKSAVGRLVAERTGSRFVDTDELVAERVGRPIPDLWAEEGEAAFRRVEAEVLAELARERPAEARVIATGGGVVLQTGNVREMRSSGMVLWLDAPAEVLMARVREGRGRPLLEEGVERLAEIAEARREAYRRAAHHRVDSGFDGPDQVARRVEELWSAS